MERIPEIDGLRALAALSVFASHAFAFTLVRVTGAGWIGVDLFFVISGYLITTILLGMRGSSHYFKNFYMRRTLRIFSSLLRPSRPLPSLRSVRAQLPRGLASVVDLRSL